MKTREQALTILHIKCNSLLVLYTLSFPARALSEPKWGCHVTGELVRQPSEVCEFLEAQISRKKETWTPEDTIDVSATPETQPI